MKLPVAAAPVLPCLGKQRQAVEVEVGEQVGFQRHLAPPSAHAAHGLAPAGICIRDQGHAEPVTA